MYIEIEFGNERYWRCKMPIDGKDDIKRLVREHYAHAADNGCGCTPERPCCDGDISSGTDLEAYRCFGYDTTEFVEFFGSTGGTGLSCGNPIGIAEIRGGETVLDLGSGAGFDCYLASRLVGETGRVIGVDMTPEMVEKARANLSGSGSGNVEFRLGEIENLPVADGSVDVIISNCVINLSPDKPRVFSEAYRVLKTGGRLAVSDIIALGSLPEEILRDPEMHCSCIAGAVREQELRNMLRDAGFECISIEPKEESKRFIENWVSGRNIADYIVSAAIKATKP
jgi:arsenite methyltransferase